MTYPSLRDWLFSARRLPRRCWRCISACISSCRARTGRWRASTSCRTRSSAQRARRRCIARSAPRSAPPPRSSSCHRSSRRRCCSRSSSPLVRHAALPRDLRSHRASYVFMLAGYTMPLVALPTVTDPSTVFDVAIARTGSCSASCARAWSAARSSRVRERGRQRDLPEPARADADRAHRRSTAARRCPGTLPARRCPRAGNASRRPSRASNSC